MRWLIYLLIVTTFSSCYLLRAYKVRHFNLTDHTLLPSVSIAKSDSPFHFADGTQNPVYEELRNYLDTNLSRSLTAAFLVIKNDSIVYERYFNGFSQQSLLPSFSVAKSFVATLVAIALKEGKIKSLQEPVTNYLPELYKRDQRFSKITLQHLLDMKSGLHFNEELYNLKDDAIKLGLRPNIVKHALKVKIERDPGEEFNYQSINTEYLALVVQRATGKKLATYLQEKVWQPLGAEYNATWNVDSKKHKQEIAFAGLNATARDFAKLGLLYLHLGQWKGKQIVDTGWVNTVNNADSLYQAGGYKNQWWSGLDEAFFSDSLEALGFSNRKKHSRPVQKSKEGYSVLYRSGGFHAEGFLKQFVYINPVNKVVIVRLGRFWSHPTQHAQQFIYNIGERF